MFYSNGNYEAFVRPRKPQGVDEKSAYLVGGGIASLAAAGFLIRDGQMDGNRITIYEGSNICGGCLDGIKDPNEGYLFRGEREMEDVPPELRSQPVLNGYSMGGPLILSGIRPYVDGRGDMYGDALVLGYKRIIEGNAAALDAAVQRWNIRWAILPLRYRRLRALLDRSPQWRRIYQDDVGAIYVRA